MKQIAYIIVCMLIGGLFYYSKLTPHKDKLHDKYRKIYDIIGRIINPVLTLLNRIASPIQIGAGIYIDVSQFILLGILLLVLKFIL